MTVIPLDTQQAPLEEVGGKASNLSRLVRAGLPVPAGFVLSTEAYWTFIKDNDLQALITSALGAGEDPSPSLLERASDQIRRGFKAGEIAPSLREELLNSYRALERTEVAVRSSATAEDLPGMSFAGQQDTFLNVAGEQELVETVVDCWSSLWTARAIAYRFRNDVPQDTVALAVIVQEMVVSDAAGVLFTANPLSGRRDEMVIEAAFGLGEGLVEGQVEPDNYTLREGDSG
ncbi:MAG: PEP/pyruvate-binding domain-containing protein, partial [Anaerolineales bacterium]|nr:PEP/pyruvate-binding domain-containing protein [Anaerolineales bacterium]